MIKSSVNRRRLPPGGENSNHGSRPNPLSGAAQISSLKNYCEVVSRACTIPDTRSFDAIMPFFIQTILVSLFFLLWSPFSYLFFHPPYFLDEEPI